MLSRAGLRRLAPLSAVAALACAALPAAAHEGQDDRPGAARMDLEVLLTPPVNGETSHRRAGPGPRRRQPRQRPRDRTEGGPAAGHDRRSAPRPTCAPPRGAGPPATTAPPTSTSPAVPCRPTGWSPAGWASAAAADDRRPRLPAGGLPGRRPRHGHAQHRKDDVVVEAVHPVAGTGGPAASTRLAAHGNGNELLHAADPAGHRLVRRLTTPRASFATDLRGHLRRLARPATLAADHGRAVRQVTVACLDGAGAVTAWTSNDAGASFSQWRSREDPQGCARAARPRSPWATTARASVARQHDHRHEQPLSPPPLAPTAAALVAARSWPASPASGAASSLATQPARPARLAAYHLRAGPGGWHVRVRPSPPRPAAGLGRLRQPRPCHAGPWAQAPDAGPRLSRSARTAGSTCCGRP